MSSHAAPFFRFQTPTKHTVKATPENLRVAVNEKSGQGEDKNKAHTKGEPLLTVNNDYEPDEGDDGDIDFLLAT